MLIEFSVENFRSIKDKVTLNLEATADKDLYKNIIEIEVPKNATEKKKMKLLKSAAIYGANASGKSSIILAMVYIKYIIRSSIENQPGQEFMTDVFLLNEKWNNKPSCFEIKFIKNNIIYDYKIKFTKARVEEESLSFYPNGRKTPVFTRKKNNTDFHTLNDTKEDQYKKNFYTAQVSENIPILSMPNIIKIKPIEDIFVWFMNDFLIETNNNKEILTDITSEMIYAKDLKKEKVLKYLQLADPTIENLEIKAEKDEKTTSAKREISNKPIFYEFITRKSINKNNKTETIGFPMFMESDGTNRFYGIIAPIITALERGATLCVDELDLRMHTNLTRAIVELFSSELNDKGAQLIFTAHDTNMLDTQTLLRRDQIWFTEKQNEGYTDLYCLSDIAVRKDKVIEKNYIKGIFGAVPLLNLEGILCDKK